MIGAFNIHRWKRAFDAIVSLSASFALIRITVALTVFSASVVVSLSEFGRIGLGMAAVLVGTQTFGYTGTMFMMKNIHYYDANNSSSNIVVKLSATLALCSAVTTFFILKAIYTEALLVSLLFGAYSFFNSFSQCLIGVVQGRALGASVMPKLVGSLFLAVIASIVLADQLGAVGFVAGLILGYGLVARSLLGVSLTVTDRTAIQLNQSSSMHPRPSSEILAIALAGLSLGVAGVYVIDVVRVAEGIDSVAEYAFGVQIRSILLFVPGIVGLQLLATFSRSARSSRDSYLGFYVAAVTTALVGIVAFSIVMGMLLLDRIVPLEAMNIPVVVGAITSGLVVAFNTPFLRLISVRVGEWYTAAISIIAAASVVAFSTAFAATPFWQTLAFAGGYGVQLILGIILVWWINETREK